MVKETLATPVEFTGTGPQSISVPSDFLKFRREDIQDNRGGVIWNGDPLELVTTGDMDSREDGWRNTDPGVPEKWMMDDKGNIRIWPGADASNVGTDYQLIRHVYLPTAFNAGNLSSEILEGITRFRGFHETIIIGGRAEFMREDGKSEEAEKLWRMYLAAVDDARGKIMNTARRVGGFRPTSDYASQNISPHE